MQHTTRINLRTMPWLVMLALLGSQSVAGPVHDVFGREILGMPWTASKAEIAGALPGGKWTNKGPLQTYTVTDSATVFHVRRTVRQKTVVALDASGKIASVAIGFPDGTETHLDLLENLTEFLGEPAAADTTVTRDAARKANVRTNWEEKELRVTLLHAIVTPTFTTNEVTVTRTPAP
jgi:hypothetical protein